MEMAERNRTQPQLFEKMENKGFINKQHISGIKIKRFNSLSMWIYIMNNNDLNNNYD